jgi:hypothetical protein
LIYETVTGSSDKSWPSSCRLRRERSGREPLIERSAPQGFGPMSPLEQRLVLDFVVSLHACRHRGDRAECMLIHWGDEKCLPPPIMATVTFAGPPWPRIAESPSPSTSTTCAQEKTQRQLKQNARDRILLENQFELHLETTL